MYVVFTQAPTQTHSLTSGWLSDTFNDWRSDPKAPIFAALFLVGWLLREAGTPTNTLEPSALNNTDTGRNP